MSTTAHCGLGLMVQIVIEKLKNRPDLGVIFNGSWPVFDAARTDKLLFPMGPFDHFHSKHQAFNYRLNVADIKEGWNKMVVYCGSHDPVRSRERNETVRIVSIEIAIA